MADCCNSYLARKLPSVAVRCSSTASAWNWFDDTTIKSCAYIAGISGVLFIARSLTFSRPVVDLRALTNRNFALGCFLSFITGIGIFSTIYLTPLFLGYVRGFSAWQTGLAIFSTGAASLIGVPILMPPALQAVTDGRMVPTVRQSALPDPRRRHHCWCGRDCIRR
jgi:hypothetical protein